MATEITDEEAEALLREVGAIGQQNPDWQFDQCWEVVLKDHPELWRIEGEPALELLAGKHPALPHSVVEIIQHENPELDYQGSFQRAWEAFPELRKVCPPRREYSEAKRL
jgi:hypothetical protein